MAIERMHFVNLIGPKEQLDTFVVSNILPFDIQLVQALSIIEDVKGIMPFEQENPYADLVKKCQKCIGNLKGVDLEALEHDIDCKEYKMPNELASYLDALNQKLSEWQKNKEQIEETLKNKISISKQLVPLRGLDIDIEKLFSFQYIKFRFGVMPKDNYMKLNRYIEKLDVITFNVYEKEDEVYLMYFTPECTREQIDGLLSSLYFNRIFISGEVSGKPKEALEKVKLEIQELKKRLKVAEKLIEDYSKDHYEKFIELYYQSHKLFQVFEVRKYAACTSDTFYITGWIGESQLKKFMNTIEGNADIVCFVESANEIKKSKPPTKIKNKFFFRPFESLVKLYGTPAYHEIDPTPLVGLTYLLMFGLMFGDIGQGAIISIIGALIFKKTKNPMGTILKMVGFSSILFGVIYGSIFGNETFLEHLTHGTLPIIKPMEQQYLVLGIGVGLGAILIIVAMLFSIINSFRGGNLSKALFDKNGIVGLVFYLAILFSVIYYMLNKEMFGNVIYTLVFLIAPMVVIFLSHPLGNLLEGKKDLLPEDKTSFFIEAGFELIEALMAILSNTISFVRLGAFALNHVGLFMAFNIMGQMISQDEFSVGKLIVMIIGNIIIIGLEGLIVGIQGLRLEYYELFSRFFVGEGQEFKPFKIHLDINSNKR